MSVTLRYLLDNVPPATESKVKAARDRTRSMLQDALRTECRLVMRTSEESEKGQQRAAVPVYIEPGCPELLPDIDFNGELEILMLLTRYRTALKEAERSTTKLMYLLNDLDRKRVPKDWPRLDKKWLRCTSEWSGELTKMLDEFDPIRRIWKKYNEDLLGAYEYKFVRENQSYDPRDLEREFEGRRYIDRKAYDDKAINPARIKLYWGIIGLTSQWIGCNIEDLTIVVLAHELAHAYTQLGADIEGRRWPAIEFHYTQKEIREGLAQYYTERVLQRLSNRYAGALVAFRRLLRSQPREYNVHSRWTEKYSPEAVRLAMLEARRKRMQCSSGFESLLDKANDRLKAVGHFEAQDRQISEQLSIL